MTKTRKKTVAAIAAVALMTSAGAAMATQTPGPRAGARGGGWGGGGGHGMCANPGGTTATATFTATERQTLIAMRQEEKLARDVYLTLAEGSSLQVFDRIAVSEQRHMDRVGALLTRYGIPDPVAGMARGEFADPAVTALYNKLVASGSASDAAALAAGVRIERLDIADLTKAIKASTQPDVKRVLTNLRSASRHHLAAFTSLR